MAPPNTAQFRVMIQQFTAFTGQSERTATRYIKASNYKLNEAVDELESMFDKLRGMPLFSNPEQELTKKNKAKNDATDQMELESTMKYLSDDLGVNLENAELFVVLELLQAPSIGEITRKGYVDGWKGADAGTTHEDHAKHVRKLVSELSTNLLLFKKVYKYVFVVGREKDQKALSVENALVYWNMLFAAPGVAWKNRHRDWLALWTAFLGEKWTRSVNRDMWNMILEFALKSLDDDGLYFWDADGAWPSVIDEFVGWCRANGVGKPEPEKMELE